LTSTNTHKRLPSVRKVDALEEAINRSTDRITAVYIFHSTAPFRQMRKFYVFVSVYVCVFVCARATLWAMYEKGNRNSYVQDTCELQWQEIWSQLLLLVFKSSESRCRVQRTV